MKWQPQTRIFIGLSIIVAIMAGLLYSLDPLAFAAFLGRINPLPVLVFILFLGILMMTALLRWGWFQVYRPEDRRGFLWATGLAIIFGIIVILFDLQVVFPEDTNVPFPRSLLFYPVMGYVVEVLFHLAPLALFLFLLISLFPRIDHEKIIWPCLLVVAALEPTFQIYFFMPDQPPFWAVFFLWIHLLLFDLTQLYLFKRYDFLSMFAFRMVYYLIWHIVWGRIRLDVLF
jgi:hypothetical protein